MENINWPGSQDALKAAHWRTIEHGPWVNDIVESRALRATEARLFERFEKGTFCGVAVIGRRLICCDNRIFTMKSIAKGVWIVDCSWYYRQYR